MKSVWTNSKYQNKEFEGGYQFNSIPHTGTIERTFVLKLWDKQGALKKVISFESWQQAKALGWLKKA